MMKNNYIYNYLFLLFILISQSVSAQAPQFSQPYSNPLLLNPAFCGETRGTRMVMNYRNQWAALSGSYRTFAFGGDKYLPGMRSGMGISVWKDVAGVNSLFFSQYSAYFAHKVRISKTQAFKAGIRLSHVTRGIDTSRMLFADQVVRDNGPASVEPNILERVNYQEIGIGFLYHSDTWWAGFSMGNVNKPNTSLMNGGEVPVPVKYSLHGGATLYQKGKRSPETLKLAWQYKAAQDWDQFDIGAYYRYEQFVMGMWYRGLPIKQYANGYSNHDALVLLVGAEFKSGWKFGYSYDMTISRLTNRSGGSHEISLSYEKASNKRRKVKIPPCVEF
jgi:type IX secretion system PorP/SprF family membrane protein